MLRLGDHVEVEDLFLGIGKVADLRGSEVEVAYFGSPASGVAHKEVVALERVRPVTLSAQTRVHWQDEETGTWRVGRVAEDGRVRGQDVGSPVDLYFVEMPNKRAARIPVPLLQVRWDRPVGDPVAFLASRTTETPFWHEGRRAFLRGVVEQRAQCQGMTGLWSSCLELTQHQASAVRTVLTDPVQRYLLADEVGLGKTIEAGAILRQYTLDEPATHSAIVIVPGHLMSQWTEELTTRFYLDGSLGDSIHVVSSEAWPTVARTRSDWGMLIVDEAHHLAASAFSAKDSERHTYQSLASLAKSTPRVILLSATPILRNEAGFLAMLHLLEPDSYPLDDLDGFRMRVESRQEIAEALSDLQDDAQTFFLEDALDRLEPLISGDARAEILSRAVRARMDDDEDNEDRVAAIRTLRDHVGEVYRLHRRLIRHRRESLPEILRGRTGADVLDHEDPVRKRLGQLLEQWREAANLDAPTHLHPALSDVYWFFLNAAMSHPLVLREAVRSRIDGRRPAPARSPRVECDPDVLLADSFSGERRILDAMLAIADAGSIQRLDPLLGAIDAARRQRQKTVVFVDTPAVANLVAAELSSRLSGVMRHSVDLDLGVFANPDGECGVLVCDRMAEEGLNLQRARAQVIHIDLPLDLGRLEQRLGRIDRFGSRIPARSVVFNGADPIEQGWSSCTRNTARVFERSIASLQYVLEDQLAWLRTQAFATGIEAVQDLSTRLNDPTTGLEAELRRIRTQEQLDTMTESTDLDGQRHEKLEDFDVDCEDFQAGLEAWAVRRLQFGRMVEERGVVRYRYDLGKSRRTLVSSGTSPKASTRTPADTFAPPIRSPSAEVEPFVRALK